MIEDCRQIEAMRVPLAAGAAAVSALPAYHQPSSSVAAPAEILDFKLRARPVALAAADRSTPVQPDQDWRRRVSGLQKLSQPRKIRCLRVMWPANDRGRKTSTEIKSTLPLHILTGAVCAFAAGLALAGAGSLAAHPELVPSLTAWLH
jgi:hypothetical protein